MFGVHHVIKDPQHVRTEALSFYTAGVTTRKGLPEPNSAHLLTHWTLDKYVPDKLRTEYISTEILQRIMLNITHKRAELITCVKKDEVLAAHDLLKQRGIKAEPSAAVAFVGLWRKNWKPDEVIIVINTG